MKIKNFYKKVKTRLNEDNFIVFLFRIIFFIFRMLLEAYDRIVFKIIKFFRTIKK